MGPGMGLRHQERHIAADEFCRVAAEEAANGQVGAFDHPTLINGYDAIYRCVQNGLDAGLALAEGLLGPFARTDVPDDSAEIALPIPGNFTHGQLNRKGGAITPDRLEFAPYPDDPRLTRRYIAGDVSVMLAGMSGWHKN